MKDVNLKAMSTEDLIKFSDSWSFTPEEQRELGKELIEREPDDQKFSELCEKVLG